VEVPQNKVQHYKLYLKGFYGNKPLAWRNGTEMWDSGYRGLCTVRGRKSNSGVSLRQYGVPAEKARHSPDFVNETMPDTALLIQGEFSQHIEHIDLQYSRIKGIPNQQAMSATPSEHARGIKARCILQHFLDPVSYDHVDLLMDCYPQAVIEFSTFRVSVGDLGWNTIFWEVRNY